VTKNKSIPQSGDRLDYLWIFCDTLDITNVDIMIGVKIFSFKINDLEHIGDVYIDKKLYHMLRIDIFGYETKLKIYLVLTPFVDFCVHINFNEENHTWYLGVKFCYYDDTQRIFIAYRMGKGIQKFSNGSSNIKIEYCSGFMHISDVDQKTFSEIVPTIFKDKSKKKDKEMIALLQKVICPIEKHLFASTIKTLRKPAQKIHWENFSYVMDEILYKPHLGIKWYEILNEINKSNKF